MTYYLANSLNNMFLYHSDRSQNLFPPSPLPSMEFIVWDFPNPKSKILRLLIKKKNKNSIGITKKHYYILQQHGIMDNEIIELEL